MKVTMKTVKTPKKAKTKGKVMAMTMAGEKGIGDAAVKKTVAKKSVKASAKGKKSKY